MNSARTMFTPTMSSCRRPMQGGVSARYLRHRQGSAFRLSKRGLEYGVQAPVFYGSLREKTVFHEYLQEYCFVLTDISGNLREFTGECNLGILYSSSLLNGILKTTMRCDYFWQSSNQVIVFVIYVHSKTIAWWEKWPTTITSHDSFNFPIKPLRRLAALLRLV